MEENKCRVMNRDNGTVGYSIPDLGIHRTFTPGETKLISLDELQKLLYVTGGEYTLKELLMVCGNDNREKLGLVVEMEYDYNREDITRLLEEGSLDQMRDCLNFAPKGVLDIMKEIAVETKLPDVRKRELLAEKLNFDINSAIEIKSFEEQEKTKEKAAERLAEPMKPRKRVITTPKKTV